MSEIKTKRLNFRFFEKRKFSTMGLWDNCHGHNLLTVSAERCGVDTNS